MFQTLCKFDFVAIYETWCEEKEKIINTLDNYVCYTVDAKRYSKHGRACGGIAVFVKGIHCQGVVRICSEYSQAVVLKLKADVLHLFNNVILICAYINPEGSVVYDCNEENGIDTLNVKVRELKSLYPDYCIFLMGDLNSRTGLRQDWIDDGVKDMPGMDWYEPDNFNLPRTSKDHTVNRFGASLIELCIENELHTLNGRHVNDQNGEYTFVRDGGCSVIDYMIVSSDMYNWVPEFYVHSLDFSCHFPLVCKVDLVNSGEDQNIIEQRHFKLNKIIGYRWNAETKEQFIRNLNSSMCCDELRRQICGTHDRTMDEQMGLFENAIHTSGKFMMYVRGGRFGRRVKKQPRWWDKECDTAKYTKYRLLRKYRCNNDNCSLSAYISARKELRELCKHKKSVYFEMLRGKLTMYCGQPTGFWKVVKGLGETDINVSGINAHEWINHFRCLLSKENTCDRVFESHVVKSIEKHDLHCNMCNENLPISLNKPFCLDELKNCVRALPDGKASGEDGVTFEMIKACMNVMDNVILTMFNNILSSGQFPESWSRGMLLPLYKSGPKENPNNYRGISLLPALGKVFTKLLNNRITEFVINENIVSEEQAAYRKGYSTIDQIFTLHSVVQKYLVKPKGRFYVIFVDFSKAFDSVSHSHLMYVLIQNGIHGSILKTIRDMYDKLKSCVKMQDGRTDYFECKIGTRQGCMLSPLLFSIFINELVLMLKNYDCKGTYVDENASNIMMLMYADDVAEGGDTVFRLQSMIDSLEQFSVKWGLDVNLAKTKIVVFRTGGMLKKVEKWFYKGSPVDVVKMYKYLGVVFPYNLKWETAVKTLATQAKKALGMLYRYSKVCNGFPFWSAMYLFDTMIVPIMLYGSEVWGFKHYKVLEDVQISYCKQLLGLPKHAPNLVALGDCGRYPISIKANLRCLKYWFKLLQMPCNRYPKACYTMLKSLDETGKHTWATCVKDLLTRNGFGHVWLEQGVGDINSFLSLFKERAIDNYKQEWYGLMHDQSKLSLYCTYKSMLEPEKYLLYLTHKYIRALARFRSSCHKLEIEVGRYNGVLLENRICKLCEKEGHIFIEDEYHFLLICPSLYNEREMYIPSYYRTDVNFEKFMNIMSTDIKELIQCVALYIMKAMTKREELLKTT